VHRNRWLYEGQHGFRPGCSITTVGQDIADPLDNGDWIGTIIVDFSEASDLVPHGRLLNKITNLRVDSKALVWIREFLLGRTLSVSVGRQLS